MLTPSSSLAVATIDSVRGEARATANVNIALIKYWGKADKQSNLPAVGSLSLTLSEWGSDTRVTWIDLDSRRDGQSDENSFQHRFVLNGQERKDPKVSRLLDHILLVAENRNHQWAAPRSVRAVVESYNTVPTASGLASSASGMAALGLAAWTALGWSNPLEREDNESDKKSLIDLVRIGSGSAVRSLLGGIVRLERDGARMTPLCSAADWALALVVCIIDPGPKAVSSREGMERTRLTSPYHKAWVDSHQADLDAATEAVKSRDLQRLGEVMEHSTFKMHASMWASSPPLRYLKGETLHILDAVERLRAQGIGAWATMDAGPHVKVLCQRTEAELIANHLSKLSGIDEVQIRYPGEAAKATKGMSDV